jgi:beta-lactamase class A
MSAATSRLAKLCQSAMTLSDNTSANLLLASLGGRAGLTQYARSLGDELTRLDRIEPELNEAEPNDARDTTTPASMAAICASLRPGQRLAPLRATN